MQGVEKKAIWEKFKKEAVWDENRPKKRPIFDDTDYFFQYNI